MQNPAALIGQAGFVVQDAGNEITWTGWPKRRHPSFPTPTAPPSKDKNYPEFTGSLVNVL
jgi:hypothetical protein